jgi:multiple antibiotic resistance protein
MGQSIAYCQANLRHPLFSFYLDQLDDWSQRVMEDSAGLFTVLLSTFGVVFAIIDPFGYVPIFLTMTANDSEERRRYMLKKACLAAFAVLAIATFVGNQILNFFGISIPALQISGGLLLLVISFEMLKVIPVVEKLTPFEENEGRDKEDISIVPLAIPMLSGPASIASVVVLTAKAQDSTEAPWMTYVAILISVWLTLLFTYFVLRSASKVFKHIGGTGLNVITRVMGLLLSAMAIQFIINGYLAVK